MQPLPLWLMITIVDLIWSKGRLHMYNIIWYSLFLFFSKIIYTHVHSKLANALS